ncbi:hypothetical protein Cob_v001046 [Colletotrichum orbiculare MAFF 240422]|uniref:Uncharacterized protein n=1 Tax=Colletotrichum orbiculare (strain 104-T / ATCC 96160 / CBS 514.97 / LARS 414 / MAFF 240422) TaxID=1213857 RepID=A0A484GAT5_COLOR|nr:hypothetical protein Cob_v001046 [Colletotrichum orbiculare MAFF 240422]
MTTAYITPVCRQTPSLFGIHGLKPACHARDVCALWIIRSQSFSVAVTGLGRTPRKRVYASQQWWVYGRTQQTCISTTHFGDHIFKGCAKAVRP